MKRHSFVIRNVDGWHYLAYPLDEKAQEFMEQYLGVRLWQFQHHEVERPFLALAERAGFKLCGA